MRIFILLLILYICSSPSLARGGQNEVDESRTPTNYSWSRFTGKDEEFSLLMPKEPSLFLNYITERSGQHTLERIYSCYDKGAVYLVVSYDTRSINGILENLKAHHFGHGGIKYSRDISLAGYKGKEYKLKFGEVVGMLHVYAAKNRGYAVATVQAVDDPPLRSYFLSSLSILTNSGQTTKVEPTPEPPSSQASDLSLDLSASGLTGKDVTRPAVLVSKPEPSYRYVGGTGTVVLKVILSSSGEVTNIRLVKGLRGLTEEAIAAAKHIKFIPAVKDGRFVSYWVQLEYNFGQD
jgi:TonB family protein